jgi:hypothetical protein
MNDPIHDPNSPVDPMESAMSAAPPSVSETAKAAWDTTRQRAEEALHTGEAYMKENPGTSVLSIFGLGFLLGVLVGWSIAHEERDSYTRMGRRWMDKLNFD